jgi:hypothetical protein
MNAIITNLSAAIQTVAPSINLGEVMLSADRRSTKETPLTDAQRIRRVVLPANHWGNISASMEGTSSQALTDVLREKLREIGSLRLKDTLEETPMLTSVPLEQYTVPALLAWSEETATSRGSLTFTRQQAEEWFTNKLWPAISGKYQPEKQAAYCGFLKNRYGALAAKNHGLAEVADATKLIALIPEALAADTISVEIVGRLTHIEKALTAKAKEATVSMSDL